MALFKFKKDKKENLPAKQTKKAVKAEPKSDVSAKPRVITEGFSHKTVLIRPRVTEKVTMLAERNIYTFEVADGATKKTVSDSIRAAYKVTPEKVSIVSIPRKKVFVRGKKGVKSGGRKAYVYLKEGDKISIS